MFNYPEIFIRHKSLWNFKAIYEDQSFESNLMDVTKFARVNSLEMGDWYMEVNPYREEPSEELMERAQRLVDFANNNDLRQPPEKWEKDRDYCPWLS